MNRNTLFIVGGVLLIAGVYFFTRKPGAAADGATTADYYNRGNTPYTDTDIFDP